MYDTMSLNFIYILRNFLSFYRQAFDQHLNLVLGEVEESVISREIDEETEEEIVKVYLNIT